MTTFGRRVIYMLMAFVALGIGLNTVGFHGNNCYLCGQSAVAREANPDGINTPANFSPVDIILQNPALPNGCEVTSLAMALTAAGYPIDHVSLYENYLPRQAMMTVEGERYSVSPEQYYVGDAAQAPGTALKSRSFAPAMTGLKTMRVMRACNGFPVLTARL